MREKLLEILAEPNTGAKLTLKNAHGGGGTIEKGELISEETGKSYPIINGIPRFVAPENYAGNFGLQWNKFREIQVDSANVANASANQARESKRRFETETGWAEDELRGKWCLDAGCGAGRFAEVAAARGPELVAMDLSSAVEATKKTLERFKNVDVVQGSLLEPPFRLGTFDYAYCIGVIQHTPDPPKAVETVASLVKQGGGFAFTIYARQPWTKLHSKYLLRKITRKVPDEVLLKAVETSMPVLFPITDVLFRMPVFGRLARFAIPVANYVERTDFTRDRRYREAVLDTFDALSPRYDSPMKWTEVDKVLRGISARNWQFRSRVPIECVGVR